MNKTNTIILGVVIGVIIIAGAIFMFTRSNGTSNSQQTTQEETSEDPSIKKITAEEIGLTLSPRADKKAINMELTQLDGISSIEYEASYDAEVVESGETLIVSRGVGPSTIEVKDGESVIDREITLGTCSRNVCKYDAVTSDINFILRVNYTNGETGQLEKTLAL